MNNKKSIIFLFIFGCFLARTIIAYTVYIITIKHLNYLPLTGCIGLIISLGFAYDFPFCQNNGFFRNIP